MKVKVETVDLNGNRTISEEERIVSNTNDYTNSQLIFQKQTRLAELTKDLAQVEAGLVIDDIEDRKQEFRTLLNEVRVLQGKQPREINGG